MLLLTILKSGKTVCLLSILGLLRYNGSIRIGNLEVSTLPSRQLRSQISVLPSLLPQLPGTIEQNLMPWRLVTAAQEDRVSDAKLEETLKETRLWEHVQAAGGTQQPMKDLSLSEYQKIQFSVASLLLRHFQSGNKIVLVDAPAQKADQGTLDELNSLMRKYFQGCTMLTAASSQQSLGYFDTTCQLDSAGVHG